MDTELAKLIGAAARRARKGLEMTQEDAADRIGVSSEFYARIERGNSLPSMPTFVRIASSLGVSADVLIGRIQADAGERLPWQAAEPPADSPELRRLVRLLRKAPRSTLRLVALLIKELDAHGGGADRAADDGEPA